ncbi:hypothetical protein Syun_013901 [Stephania yunnanensis]|uniref:Cystatin domain-containing protein n=1 Tax=Stephania yunnanensis TaxID=152371 RepID=A0AAP0JIA3_9MAGN
MKAGGWVPIDVHSPHSIELARFAVNEHNKEAHTHLKFERLVKGESQIVDGVNYRLTISATNGGLIQTYEALVYEGLDHKKVLKSFKVILAVKAKSFFGVNYKLIINAINRELIQTYEARVFEALDGERVLNSFTVVITSDIPQPGGWQPVEDVKEVEGIGRFAVAEHNKEAHTHLKFEGVLKGETQIVEGINYRLTIRAINGELIHNYEALVFKDLKGHKNLVSFLGTVA